MSIKCLHPVVLLNPEAIKKSLEFDVVYIKGRAIVHIMELFIHQPYKLSPKKYGVTLDDVDNCYLLNKSTGETLPLYIVVPCGKCLLCNKRKANALATRAIMETEMCGSAPLFITLTYSNEYLPLNEKGFPTLRKQDFQLFMKRLRSLLDARNIEHSLRYFVCGEYGSKTKRPHYHLLLWNFPVTHFKDMVAIQSFIQKAWSFFRVDKNSKRIPMRDRCLNCPFSRYLQASKCSSMASFCTGRILRNPNNSIIYHRFPIGMVKVLPSNAGAPAYITKYMVKGSNAPDASCLPPFRCASNRGGGIGASYILQYADYIRSTPSLECLPVADKVTGSGRIFYMPIDTWVKSIVYPSASMCLKNKDYQVVREFVSTFTLFQQSVQQLYRLYPMDTWIDGELHYYYDSFCNPLSRSEWKKAYEHVKQYVTPFLPNFNIGSWMKNRDYFNEYIYTLTERLDNLARKVLTIDIDDSYFCQRDLYLKTRINIFKQKYGSKETNLIAFAENIPAQIKKNKGRENF